MKFDGIIPTVRIASGCIRCITIILLLVLSLGLPGCGGDNNSGVPGFSQIPELPTAVGELRYVPESCDVLGQNRFVHRVMMDTYFWYREVPTIINYADFDSPEAVLDFVRYYPERDNFSYITTIEQHTNFFQEGEYIGVGFSFLSLADDRLVTRFVYPDSPADLAGMVRGDEVLKINGQTIKEINDGMLWDTIFGADDIGVVVELEILHQDSSIEVITVEKAVVKIKSVLHREILDRNGIKVGYFVFNTFIGPSEGEFVDTFAEFQAAGISELILDLRYNGGGRVDVARKLASYIYGMNSGSEIVANFKHNDRYPDWAWNLPFTPSLNNRMENLQRVFVLTQPGTCSASELVINSLKPFMEVIQIGQATCGKPVGMYGHEFCGKRIQPIEFETTNHNDEGGYFDGITPNCVAEDDPFQRFATVDENLLSATLNYIDNGICPVVTALQSEQQLRSRVKNQPDIYTGFRREIGAF